MKTPLYFWRRWMGTTWSKGTRKTGSCIADGEVKHTFSPRKEIRVRHLGIAACLIIECKGSAVACSETRCWRGCVYSLEQPLLPLQLLPTHKEDTSPITQRWNPGIKCLLPTKRSSLERMYCKSGKVLPPSQNFTFMRDNFCTLVPKQWLLKAAAAPQATYRNSDKWKMVTPWQRSWKKRLCSSLQE